MKKKRLIFFFFLGFFIWEMQAQFDAQFSQYAENKEAINPGAVAENDLLNLFGVYRQQWAGFKNAPSDMFFSVNTPVSIEGTDHGVGLSFFSNSAGLFLNNSVLLQYSYKMKLFDGVLGLGLNVGAIWQAFNLDGRVDFTGGEIDGNDFHVENDPSVPKGGKDDTPTAFDAGVGCFFSNKKMYVGLSALHLTAPSMSYDGLAKDLYVPRVFYLTGGYNISLSNTLYVLKPSTLIKTDFKSYQMELTGLLEYNKTIQGGLSYRFQDAFVFIVGINLFSGLYAAYSYDLPISRMILSGGSHEISLRYSFKPQFAGQSKYKVGNIL